MDVKIAILNREIEEEVYIEKPNGFVVHGKESHVCKLKKALYGLKQAPCAPVARYTSIRTIIALASAMKWRLHQMDVKIAFLNGEIEEEVYVEQPDAFVFHFLPT